MFYPARNPEEDPMTYHEHTEPGEFKEYVHVMDPYIEPDIEPVPQLEDLVAWAFLEHHISPEDMTLDSLTRLWKNSCL